MKGSALKRATFEDVCDVLGLRAADHLGLSGHGWHLHTNEDDEVLGLGVFANLITDVGDQLIMERAYGIAGAPAQIVGMQLGSGVTAASKTGAGAAIVTLVAASLVAIDGGFPTSSQPGGAGTARRVQFRTTWAAGVATSTAPAIAEVVLTNQGTGTQTAAPAANTSARALLSTTVQKAAGDSLIVTWNHDGLGA